MAPYSLAQVEQLWIDNGGDPAWAPFMAGVAFVESGLDFQALADRPSTNDYSVGLWQHNYFDSPPGYRQAQINLYGTPEALRQDPNKQAAVAVRDFGVNGASVVNAYGGDPFVRGWLASGSPQKPDSATVQQILAKAGKPYTGTGATGGAGSSTTSSSTTSPTTQGAVTEAATGCNQAGAGLSFSGIDIPGVTARPGQFSGLGNACQLKALSGGLMIGLGGAMLFGGVVLLVVAISAGTKSGKAAAGIVGGAIGGPAGAKAGSAAAGVVGAAGTTSKRTATRTQSAGIANLGDPAEAEITAAMERSAKEQTRQRRTNPSAAQKQFESNRRAGQRANRFALRAGEEPF